jgi:hypothetical protein
VGGRVALSVLVTALARTELGDFPLAREHGRWLIIRI